MSDPPLSTVLTRWPSLIALAFGLAGCGESQASGGPPGSGATAGAGGTSSAGGDGGAAPTAAAADSAGGVASDLPGSPTLDSGEVFIGPFATWADVMADYGAQGDGTTDDTAAIQSALDEIGNTGKSKILFFPSGSYRITQTLRLFKKEGVAILGEDPVTTRLVWASPTRSAQPLNDNVGVMLLNQGSAHFRLGRLTFDGQGKASYGIRHRWGSYATDELFPSGIEQHDLLLQNLDVGISAGFYDGKAPQDTAEYSHVVRSKFVACRLGLETADFNSLLWGVLDSRFENNEVGVRVALGNANVYDSTFIGSKDADISTGNVPFLGVRGNYSSGSQHFFTTENPMTLTLQGNTVVGTLGTPVVVPHILSLALIDNTIDSGTVPPLEFNGQGALLSVGNVLSASSLTAPKSPPLSVRSLDDKLGQTITPVEPSRPGFLAPYQGSILTVEGSTGASIQQAIDQAVAAAAGAASIVVYVPAGDVTVPETLHVPPGVALHLVGEPGSKLTWTGAARGELLKLDGPSRARVQDLSLSGGYNGSSADTLVVANADQPGGSIVFYGLSIVKENTSGVGLFVDGVDQSQVELVLPYYMGGKDGAIRVVGGPAALDQRAEPANVTVLDAFPRSGSGDTYQVSDNARVLALDQWAETDQRHYLRLRGAARFSLSNASFGFGPPLAPDDDPVIGALGVSGSLAIVGGIFAGSVLAATGDNPAQNMLVALTGLGGWGLPDDGSKFIREGAAGTSHLLLSSSAKFDAASPPNDTNVTDAWLGEMLGDLRRGASTRLVAAPSGATDVRVLRLDIGIADNGVRVSR